MEAGESRTLIVGKDGSVMGGLAAAGAAIATVRANPEDQPPRLELNAVR